MRGAGMGMRLGVRSIITTSSGRRLGREGAAVGRGTARGLLGLLAGRGTLVVGAGITQAAGDEAVLVDGEVEVEEGIVRRRRRLDGGSLVGIVIGNASGSIVVTSTGCSCGLVGIGAGIGAGIGIGMDIAGQPILPRPPAAGRVVAAGRRREGTIGAASAAAAAATTSGTISIGSASASASSGKAEAIECRHVHAGAAGGRSAVGRGQRRLRRLRRLRRRLVEVDGRQGPAGIGLLLLLLPGRGRRIVAGSRTRVAIGVDGNVVGSGSGSTRLGPRRPR